MKLGSPEAMRQEPHDDYLFEKREEEHERLLAMDDEEREEYEYQRDMYYARHEYDHEKARAERRATGTRVTDPEDEDECPHDEHDHYICLDCGKDIMDDLISRADMMRDE